MKLNRLKIIFISIGLVLIIALLVVPTLIKSYVVKNSPELIGRQVALENLRYNYFTSTVRAHDFKMFEANGEDVFVSFDTLLLDLEPLKFLQNTISIEQFYVSGLFGEIVMEESSFNFDDLLAFHLAEDSTVVEEESEAFKYEISNIEFKDVDFKFEDKTVEKVTEIRDADVIIPFIAWDQNAKSNADIAFELDRGGSFQSSFNFDPESGDFDAEVTVTKLYLDPFFEYVKEYADINSFEGYVDAKVSLIGNAFDPIKTIVAVDARAFDFEMTDTTDQRFLGAEEAHFVASKIDYDNSFYQIDKIEVLNSYTFFQLDSASNNFFRIFRLDEESTQDSTSRNLEAETEESIEYRIGELILHQGALDYTDNLTGEPFEYKLTEIEIDSKELNSDSDWLTINSTMILNGRGNLTAALGINPSDYDNLNLDITVEKFLLPDLNIYTNYYMGHSVVRGDMYYYSNSKIVDGQIVSENRLLVKDAKLETTEGGLYSLPLKFAFFLLTDRNGDVDLEIPVRGDLNDPTLKLSTIIWNTFKNVIDKVVLAPVDFLVGLVGGDPKELEEIVFDYTDTIPGNKQFRQLAKLVDLEQKKDGLAITLNYYVDQDLQNEAIAKNLIGAEFNGEKQDYQKDEEEFQEFVIGKVGSDSLSFEEAIRFLTKDQNIDSIRRARTDLLFKYVNDHLKEEKPTTEIKIEMGDPEAPENIGAYPIFKITYDMLSIPADSTSIN
ncbi:DUF748 domain-containing protein [Algoriphagus namhaensis]